MTEPDTLPAELSTGKLHKVLYFDEAGEPIGETPSTQLPEDPFTGKMQAKGLQKPPYSLEQLVLLSESHPVHASCLEQKTVDTVGQGWKWLPDVTNSADDEAEPDVDTRAALDDWFEDLADGEMTMHEILTLAWGDYQVTGQGYLEIVRDGLGVAVAVYHVPAHTVRFHQDGIRIAQVRGQKTVWFKRWGAPTELLVDRQYGSLKAEVPEERLANDLLVLQKPSRRSSWYGLPGYIPSIGWISLALSARDDNLLFFSNRREPRWAVILTNLEDDPGLEDDLRNAFAVDLKQPHRNLLIPISGNGKIDFKQLSADRADGSYEKLSDRADAAILVGHRVPPERLGLTKVGALGGNVSIDSTRVYKEAVIEPDQALLAARMNRFIEVEYPKSVSPGKTMAKRVKQSFRKAWRKATRIEKSEDTVELGWTWSPVAIDLAEEEQDLRQAIMAFKAGGTTLDEFRVKSGMDPLDEEKFPGIGDKFYWEIFGGKEGDQSSGVQGPEDHGDVQMSRNVANWYEGDVHAQSMARIDSAIAALFEE